MSNEEMKVDFDSITNMAKRLGLKGTEAGNYVHEHMTKLGYKSRRSYYKEDKQTSGSSFSFFGGKGGDDDDDTL